MLAQGWACAKKSFLHITASATAAPRMGVRALRTAREYCHQASLPLLKSDTILSKIELSTQPKEKRLALRRLKKSRTEPTRIVADLSPNISGRVIPCRWQQQHRASACIRHWLNP